MALFVCRLGSVHTVGVSVMIEHNRMFLFFPVSIPCYLVV